MSGFETVAPYLKNPLVLIGFFIFIVFLFLRTLIVRGIIPTVGKKDGYNLLRLILLYGFLFGLVLMVLGFGLQYRQLDTEEQRNVVRQLSTEFNDNISVVSELKKNTETFLNISIEMSKVLRTKSITILPILFPQINLDLDSSVNTIELANEAFDEIVYLNLHQNELEMNRFRATGSVIISAVDKTKATLESLADSQKTRYKFTKQTWEGNLPVLKKIQVVDISSFQENYAKLERLRNNYDVVASSCIEFQTTVAEFFNPASNKLTKENLAVVLSKERQMYTLIHSYTMELYYTTKEFVDFQTSLNHYDNDGELVN